MTTTVLYNRQTYIDLVDVVAQSNEAMKKIAGGSLVIMAQPISQSMVNQSRARGEDPMNVTPTAQLCMS